MNVLVIDDVRIMDFDCEYARNVEDAWCALTVPDEVWDEVWFDHDLGGDETTRPLLMEIERRFFTGDGYVPNIKKCIVHTSNSASRNWIVAALENSGYDVEVRIPPAIGAIDV